VPLEVAAVARARRRERVLLPVDDVDSLLDAAAQDGLGRVDTRVEERDRDAAAVEAGQGHVRPSPRPGPERVLEARRVDGGIRGADRVDPLDLRRPLEQRDRPGIERRGEAVQDPRVVERRLDVRTLEAHAGDELPLRSEGRTRPRALLPVAHAPARRGDPL
jgi:hypothetical protein